MSDNFLSPALNRSPSDQESMHDDRVPLLTIASENIVPLPLHIFLGIGNRIIKEAMAELLGDDELEERVGEVKTIHTLGKGGASDLYDLNGVEISKFIRHNSVKKTTDSPPLPDTTRASLSLLSRWLQQLQHFLLRNVTWEHTDIQGWREAVTDIQQHWEQETHTLPFPKLHMLSHTVDFMERHRILGVVSESEIESFHSCFNRLFNEHHSNTSRNETERIRRCLADSVLLAVRPRLKGDLNSNS